MTSNSFYLPWKKKGCCCVLLAFIGVLTLSAEEAGGNPTAKYIQRTMHKLAESTLDRPQTVRILFYGQSIVEQGWCTNFVMTLRRRYPTADIQWRNLAIGGFESPLLVKTAEADLYPYYADLTVFHDYGPTKVVRTMIERLRARTTSEILMYTSHLGDTPADRRPEAFEEKDKRSLELIKIAEDNHCMLVHLRRKWGDYLKANNLKNSYFCPNIHLRFPGPAFEFYSKCLTDDMVVIADSRPDPLSGKVEKFRNLFWYGDNKPKTERRGAFVRHPDGRIDFDFVGNRVVAEAGSSRQCYNCSPTKILLDGREMSTMKELFHHGRVGNLLTWMPLIFHVGSESVPVEETWTLTFVEGTNPFGHPIRFRVDGSVTGFDGEGSSDKDFVSRSGRVKFAAADFHLWQYDYFVRDLEKRSGKRSPARAMPGQWTSWKTYRDFNDRIGAYFHSHEQFLIVSGCANGPHRLTFIPAIPTRPPQIESLIVHTPAGTEPSVVGAEKEAEPVNPDFRPEN